MVSLDSRFTCRCRRLLTRLMLCSGCVFFVYAILILSVDINSSRYVSEHLPRDDCVCPNRLFENAGLSKIVSASTRSSSRLEVVSCMAMMEGSDAEMSKALLYMNFHPFHPVTPAELALQAQDCDEFRRNKGYGRFPVTQEEKGFPVSFSILVHRDVDQLERLLRSIYRPHNHYCIHVDANSPSELLKAVISISRCFRNVYIPPKMEAITYAHFSRLQADLACMKELVLRGAHWRYLINLTGQMFPLKTNLEIVKILATYEGSNDIEGLSRYVTTSMKVRYQRRHKIVDKKLISTGEVKEPPPHGITLVKGSAYGAYTRQFIEYVLQNPIVQDFLNWTRDVYSPDEFFWASLNSRWVNPMFRSPGGHDLPPERKPWLTAYAAWRKKDDCRGKFVRNICIFGIADLPSLIGRRELFANKFYADYQYLTLDCLEEWLTNKTKHHLPIDLDFYKNIRRLLRSS